MRRCCSNRNDNPHVSIRVVTAEKFTSYQHFIVLSLPLLTTIICLLLLLELAITHSHLIPKLSVFLTCSLTWFSEILINAGLKMSKSFAPHAASLVPLDNTFVTFAWDTAACDFTVLTGTFSLSASQWACDESDTEPSLMEWIGHQNTPSLSCLMTCQQTVPVTSSTSSPLLTGWRHQWFVIMVLQATQQVLLNTSGISSKRVHQFLSPTELWTNSKKNSSNNPNLRKNTFNISHESRRTSAYRL